MNEEARIDERAKQLADDDLANGEIGETEYAKQVEANRRWLRGQTWEYWATRRVFGHQI